MTRGLERLLRLGSGELGPGLLLFTYLFLVLAACTAGRSTRDALFIARFQALRLPYADLSVVLAVTLVAAGYMRLGRLVSLRNLLVGSLLAFALTTAVFWGLVRQPGPSWLLLPALYVWVGVLGVLAPTQVWTLANYVLTLRQAKRLFALVGTGSILGSIAGGAGAVALIRARGAESVLLAMATAFVACAMLVPAIWRVPSAARRGDARRPERGVAGAGGLRDAARTVLDSPYLRLIAALIGMASLVATITSYQFKAIASQAFPEKDQLAAFFAAFSSVVGLIALAVQLVLTTPILRRVGIGAALSIVPLALGAGSAGLLAFGSLAAVMALRGSDQVLRYSIDKSAVELLYLPVSRSETFKVKSFLDTVVCRLGDAVASLLILLVARRWGATPAQLAWPALVVLGAWVAAAHVVQRRYLRNLEDALHQNRVDVQGATAVLDRATTQLLASHLAKGESKRVLSALSLVEASPATGVLPSVAALLSHPSAAVRARAVGVLSENLPATPPPGIEALLSDPDLRVRSAALVYMARAGLDPLKALQQKGGDFADLSVRSSMVVYLARPGSAQNLDACRELLDGMVREPGREGRKARVEAARLLASLPRVLKDRLAVLLDDEDPDVVRHAIRAAGRLRASRFVPRLIDAMASPDLAPEAAAALARFGDRVVPTLATCLADPGVKVEARRHLPRALLKIATPAAEQVLIGGLSDPDATLRFQAASALARLKRRYPDPRVDPTIVEKALVAELLGHYRGYLGVPSPGDGGVVLSAEKTQQLECIFRLLQLFLPGQDINSAYVGLQSSDPVIHDKALELLDNILAPHLRSLLVPLIDAKVDWQDRARIARRTLADR